MVTDGSSQELCLTNGYAQSVTVPPRPLTPKQEKFCQLFVDGNNASECYRMSYRASKSKPATVNRSAKELLDNPKIATRIDALRAELQTRNNVTRDELVQELKYVAFGNIFDFIKVDPLGSISLDSAALSGPKGAAIQDLVVASGSIGERKKSRPILRMHIRLHDKLAALEQLGKYLGLFSERLVIGVDKENPLQAIVDTVNATPLLPSAVLGRNESGSDSDPT